MSGLVTLGKWQVQHDWVDYNGHMNDAAYALVFSRAVDVLMDRIGLDAAGRKSTGRTIYTLALMIRYIREAFLGTELQVAVHILEHDPRRLRLWLEMRAASGDILATSEQLLMCISTADGKAKVGMFTPEMTAAIVAIAALQADLPLPEGAGEGISLRRRR